MAAVTRRIQLTGGSTYIISIPGKWVKENGLDRGSEVSVEEVNGNLVVSARGQKTRERNRRINITKAMDRDLLQRVLTAAYIAGFDTLVVRSNQYISQEMREDIKRFAKVVMGVEIFEEGANSIVLQNVLDSSTFPLNKAINRMALNVDVMIQDTIKGIEDSDTSLLGNVIQRDDEVDRYQWYVYREVRSRSCEDSRVPFFLIISRILERIADHAVNICRTWQSPADVSSVRDEVINGLRSSHSLLKEALEAFYSTDLQRLNAIVSKKGSVVAEKVRIIERAGNGDALIQAISVSEDIARIGLYSTDIAELAMDMIMSSRDEISL
ncbi:hypothetical protein GCM10007108_03780 [Thermogymnomonas acidicola]|uniref:SpoVT-AbrB domain-containing protein n=2 Tax=Thermogymnomonas acidicola TaxID=399579 RepID=A0AA37BQF8_9ARCH|nr:phosphate uptake regulator PhoU [Thermogymnomonas acidicola]GGM68887.1 hypothetical protein GCM10007108_03780 [Thermogymnomonas acidicola]